MKKIAATLVLGLYCTLVFAAETEADTNIAVARQDVFSNQCPHVIEASENSEFSGAICRIKDEYRERYEEMKGAHDRFMMYLTILVTLGGVLFPLLYHVREERRLKEFRDDANRISRQITELEHCDLQFRRFRATDSLSNAKFIWDEFLHLVHDGNALDRCIAEPLYRIADALVLANQIDDRRFLQESVNAVALMIRRYDEVVGLGSDLHAQFRKFVREKKILIDSICFNDLVKKMEVKTDSLETVLRFMNEFGIKMFGEVS